jgi:HAD superfamily hydrolase (TIGR01509 family)
MLRAVIFDFDGVITDSEVLHFRAFNEVLGPLGVKIESRDYYSNYLGFTDLDCFKTLREEGKLSIELEAIDELIEKKNEVFTHLAETEGSIIEGVGGFLSKLCDNNIPMAICSGALGVEIAMILEDAGLKKYFEVIVAADHVKRGKPDPEGFLLTLKRLNKKHTPEIKPGDCVVIEDARWGLQAATAAGMHTVAITNSYDAKDLMPSEKIISHLSELTTGDLESLCR